MGFLDRLLGSFRAPASGHREPTGDPLRLAEVEAVLARVRPLLARDGGDVALVAVDGGRVEVRWVGACTRCCARESTLRLGLEPALRDALPWFRELAAG